MSSRRYRDQVADYHKTRSQDVVRGKYNKVERSSDISSVPESTSTTESSNDETATMAESDDDSDEQEPVFVKRPLCNTRTDGWKDGNNHIEHLKGKTKRTKRKRPNKTNNPRAGEKEELTMFQVLESFLQAIDQSWFGDLVARVDDLCDPKSNVRNAICKKHSSPVRSKEQASSLWRRRIDSIPDLLEDIKDFVVDEIDYQCGPDCLENAYDQLCLTPFDGALNLIGFFTGSEKVCFRCHRIIPYSEPRERVRLGRDVFYLHDVCSEMLVQSSR